jgi:hypothetical protein
LIPSTNNTSPLTLEEFQNSVLPKIGNMLSDIEKSIKNDLKKQVKHLPTKEEYFTREDETMGELKKLREEVAMTGQHYEDTNKRVDKIDKYLNINSRVL